MKLLNIPEIIGAKGVFTDGDWVESKDQDPKGKVRLLQLADVGDGVFLNKSNRRLTKNKATALRCTYLLKGDILLARMPDPLGRCCIFPGLDEECVTVVDVCIIRLDNLNHLNRFVSQLINSSYVRSQISRQATGTTRIRISRGNLSKIKMPVPPLNDQTRIAHLLEKVEGLITQRKQHLQQLDELLKSVFLDMFGDPVRNEKGWETLPCNEVVINIQSGTSYGGEEKDEIEDDEYGVLKISAVTAGILKASEFKAVKKSIIKKNLKFVKKGDFLFSRANTVELVAACCIADQDYPNLFIPDKLWLLTFADMVQPQYFNFLLKSRNFRNQVRKKASGGHDSMLNIAMKKFLTLTIPVPPIDIQSQFAIAVHKIEASSKQYQKSLTDLENLYGALSQKAFKGELDLSAVPLPYPAKESESPLEVSEDRAEYSTNTIAGEVYYDKELPKDKSSLLRQWFTESVINTDKNNELSLDQFWTSSKSKIEELADDEGEIQSLDLEDYDQLKAWIFSQIKTGKIEQINNTVKLDEELVLGNRILLKQAT